MSISLLLAVASVYAVPAKRGVWHNIPVSGGMVRAELAGDEFFNYYKSEAGVCYVLNANSGLYELVDVEAMQHAAAAKRSAANTHRMSRAAVSRKQGVTRTAGAKKGLVVLVEFKDMKFSSSEPQKLYDDILNAENYKNSEIGFVGSVRDYFRDQSNGQLLMDFDVVGPVQLPNNYAYYGANNGLLGSDEHPDEMVEYACKAVEDAVNFAEYDWNYDGVADQVCILYAGRGEASGGDANTIWPHEGELSRYGKKVVVDGVTVNTYACSCELGEHGTIDGIGTFCHEFSHCLGLPDMYDTGGSGNYGMYRWDLMSFGNYNGDSFVPAAYTSYERWLAGWLEPVELNEDTSVSGMKALADGGPAYIIYNDGHKDEYYLLENRQKTGWDAGLPGEGLLVTHVDYDFDAWRDNTINAGSHQRFTPIAADNSYVANDDDCAGDVFPYNGNNSLTSSTTPAITLYNKNSDGSYNLHKSINDITQNNDGTISFTFKVENDKPQPDADGNWFYESFDNCAGVGGNDGDWRNRGTGGTADQFVADNSGWILTSSNAPASACMKTSSGAITSPQSYFNFGTEVVFKAAPCNGDKKELTLSTERGMLTQTSFTLKDGEWTECRSTLNGEGYTSLTFETGGAFFIDELRVYDPNASGIINLQTPATADGKRIYSIDGRYLGNDFNALGKGLYIVNGKKIVK